MIGYLKGQIIEHTDGKMLVTLGAAGDGGAVGYLITVPHSPAYIDFQPGKPVELFIHTHVREDALDLYGFSSRGEKELFLTLLTVNGIGPKGAMNILSKVGAGQLIQAIMDGDKDNLVQIPGIGKKTAERVVLELSDPLRKKVEAGLFNEVGKPSQMQASKSAAASTRPPVAEFAQNPRYLMHRDAKEALLGLGYREQDVAAMLQKVFEDQTVPTRVEDIIRSALQQLG